jgi:DNA-binding response OmpR family regulator
MSSGKRTVAVVSADGTLPPDVGGPLTRHGFAVRPFALTATAIPAEAAAVLVLVDGNPDAAVAFTRRCRVDTPSPRPVVWLFAADAAHSAPTGFDAGADVCLVRPVDPDILTAQVGVLLRSYSELSRVAVKGADTAELSERLAKVYRQNDADADLARRLAAGFATVGPLTVGSLAADWVHVPSTRRGVNTLAVLPTGVGIHFALVTVGGLGATTGAALAEAVTRFLLNPLHPPPDALTQANRRVRALNLPDAAMLAATVGVVESSGQATVACGGHPPPVFAPADGPARLWHGVGAFLGQSDATNSELTGELKPGDRLLLLGGGAAADKRPDVRAAADEQPKDSVSEFVRAVCVAVFNPADADDGWTLLAVGRTGNSSGTISALTEPEQ